jgi:hypothetical protein
LGGDFAPCLIFSKSITFQKPALFSFIGQEAPNLVDPLDWVILCHWASQKQQLKIWTWENNSNRKMAIEKLKHNYKD